MRVFSIALFCILFILSNSPLSGQERVSPKSYNAGYEGKEASSAKTVQMLTLPFEDDFSYEGPYPDPLLWTDDMVYINNTYAIDPISIGVATLEGLGADGLPHNPDAPATQSQSADTLTSQFIDLDALSPTDSVVISFYYQAQGYGFELGPNDSLLLQFKNDSMDWVTVWYSLGIPLDDFQQAAILVDEDSFFHSEFQFRFRNYASLTGNNDQWHIDFIRMDDNRSLNETILQDAAILYEPSSILSNYTQMPWNQFYDYQFSELNSNHFLSLRNNDNINLNTTYEYVISESNTGDILADQSPFAIILSSGVILDQQLTEPINITTDYATDTVEFILDYTITPNDQYPQNDNVTKIQHFGNQLAYDDGSSELSYGLFSDGAQLAMEYTLNEPDSLRAVAIHFTTIENDQSDRFFSLIVWDDIDIDGFGQNSVELARMDLQRPEYQPEYNGFTYYVLPEAVAVDGTFYIGMAQEGTEEFYLGYDKNNEADEHTYYNLSGEWIQSSLNGAVMMRPVLGGKLPTSVNVDNIDLNNDIILYPNPVEDVLYIESASLNSNMTLSILNAEGRLLLNQSLENTTVNLSELSSGLYMVLIQESDGTLISQKKIIKH